MTDPITDAAGREVAVQDDNINALDIDDVPLNHLKQQHRSRDMTSSLIMSATKRQSAPIARNHSYYSGATSEAWDHLATFCCQGPQSDESDNEYGDPKKLGELRAGDVVSFFYYPKAFGDTEGLVWDRITSIITHHSDEFGPGAELSVAGLHSVTYYHHRVDAYRHDISGKLVDVTGGNLFLWSA